MPEEVLGKAYDGRLMRRLMAYARPFALHILLCIVMVFLVTAADLSRPYLLKVAIDSHIDALSTPMVRYAASEVPSGVPDALYGGNAYVRTNVLSHAPAGMRYEVLTVHGRPYLITLAHPLAGQPALKGNAVVSARGSLDPAQRLSTAGLAAFRSQDVNALRTLALLYLLAIVVAFAINYGQTFYLQWVGQHIIANLRRTVMAHVMTLDTAFFDHNPVGRLVTRVTNDVEALNEMYTSVLVNFFRDISILIGSMVIMADLNMHLALISFVTIPVIFAVSTIYRNRVRGAYRQVRLALARINAFLSENIQGMRVVQSFHRQERQSSRFDTINRSYLAAGFRELTLFAVFRPFMDFLYVMLVAFLIWYGGGRVLLGVVTLGVLYAMVNYVQQFFQPVNDMADKFSILQQAMASSERIFLLLDTKPAIKDPPQPKSLPRLCGEVVFENVWFAYTDEEWVLRDVSFRIRPGETVAFVGATGAGKTSILSLLTRLYDCQKGRILVDGVDIRDLGMSNVRRQVAVVQQDVFLFAGTIASNIRLGAPISDERLHEVTATVNADRFIRNLPGGLDEPVMERGSTLSSGERQLLSFARALAFDPAILVLDEATASIDTETEQLIQEALLRLMANRTTIVVAHRLSTIQDADRIIVLHKGRIRETGKHEELLARGGLYYDLYRLQYKEDLDPVEPIGSRRIKEA